MSDRLEFKAQLAVDDAGEVTGIAWPFGSPDQVGDVIEKGAFSTSPATLPMLWSHDQAEVVGVWDQIAETAEGLTVKGRLLVDDVARAREVRALLKAGAVSGLSIGFVSRKALPRKGGGRTISALDLHEISVVAVPCHPDARIHSVKGGTVSNEETQVDKDDDKTQPANDAPAIDMKALDAINARLDQIEAKGNRLGAPAITQGAVEGKAFGTFLRLGADRMEAAERKALSVATNANGGYLAPSEYGSELVKLLTELSPIRQHAKVMTVEAPSVIMPRRLTGAAAAWTDEGADMSASDPTFGQITIANHELSTYFVASNKLLEDNAYDLEGELMAELAENFAATEGLAFVKGTGTGQPKGLMTATGITEVVTGKADGFPVQSPADVLISMFHSIPTGHAHNAVWVMNRATLAEVRKWRDGIDRYLVIDPQDGAPSQLLGRPVVEAKDMDNIAAGKYPILFGDLGGYRIVDRVGLSILRDPFTLGSKSQVRFIARKRVGADVTHTDRFVKLKVAAA